MRNIYIVISQTGTLFSRLLALYTKDPYNHASIAFDSSLQEMYSFGRRRRYNMLDSGFIIESISGGLFIFFPQARCCVLEIPVTDAEYSAIRDEVDRFCRNHKKYKYNLLGVFTYIFGKSLAREDYYFCSQFVSYLLNKTSFWIRAPQFTRPMDFMSIPNRRIIYEGKVADFCVSHSVRPVSGATAAVE
jgi:hypothetical protein